MTADRSSFDCMEIGYIGLNLLILIAWCNFRTLVATVNDFSSGWWRGTVVERRSLAGELSLSCTRPAADG